MSQWLVELENWKGPDYWLGSVLAFEPAKFWVSVRRLAKRVNQFL